MLNFDIIEHFTSDLAAASSYKAALENIEDSIVAEDFPRALEIVKILYEAINDSINILNKQIDFVINPFLRNGFTEITPEEFETIEAEMEGAVELTDVELNELLGIRPMLGTNE